MKKILWVILMASLLALTLASVTGGCDPTIYPC